MTRVRVKSTYVSQINFNTHKTFHDTFLCKLESTGARQSFFKRAYRAHKSATNAKSEVSAVSTAHTVCVLRLSGARDHGHGNLCGVRRQLARSKVTIPPSVSPVHLGVDPAGHAKHDVLQRRQAAGAAGDGTSCSVCGRAIRTCCGMRFGATCVR